jgi:hypothetical protein
MFVRMRCESGVYTVSSQTVHEFRSGKVRFASSDSNTYFVPGAVVSICESPAFSRPAKDPLTDSDPDGLGCARGVRAAFILELGAAILAYGAWQLWHLVR